MDNTEVQSAPATDAELLTWDWRAELKSQERSMSWLARRTQRSESAVNKYNSGVMVAPVAWLRQVAIVLDWSPG